MKKIVQLVAATVLVFASFTAIAADERAAPGPAPLAVDTKGLSAEQIAAVKAQVAALNASAEQMRKSPDATTVVKALANSVTPSEFAKWPDAGTNAGQAVANFIREVGMSADEFLETTAGKYATVAIAWKLGAAKVTESVINVVLHLLMGIVLYTAWWWLTRLFVFGQVVNKTVEYNENLVKRWLGMNKTTKTIQRDADWHAEMSDDNKLYAMVWSRVASVVGLLAITLIVWPRVSF